MTNLAPKYNYFIGLDIAKSTIDLAIADNKTSYQYPNSKAGWFKLYKEQKNFLSTGLTVMENTGGYEQGILTFLAKKKFALHCSNASKIKFFIRSLGGKAKTDRIDAQYIASFAKERHALLRPYSIPKENLTTLQSLVRRRQDLVQIMVKEKNRKKAPLTQGKVLDSLNSSILFFTKAIAQIDAEIKQLINTSTIFEQKQKQLMLIPGVGEKTAANLIALMPELGQLSSKQIASLAGLAPHPFESGQYKGYRRVYAGRESFKPVLYMAALAAKNSHSFLGEAYKKLIVRGKKPLVALVAIMRRIVVIANAKLRDLILTNTPIKAF